MAVSISGSVALVTGANRGIGRALVKSLIEKGASKVYAGARTVSKLEDLIAAGDGKVVGVQLDVTKGDQIEAAAAAAPDLTLLINNAGTAGGMGLSITDKLNLTIGREEMEVNVFGTLATTQSFAPTLAADGGGAVVNVVSVGGLVNFPLIATYSASKAALHSLTQALRFGLQEQNTFVAGVYPGPVDTDMAADVPLEKTPPSVVADNILNALETGEEEIFPDEMAQQMGAGYEASPKELERGVAAMMVELAAQA